MPTPNFPAELPGVVMDDYGFKPGNPNIRTDMESGLARTRRRFLSVPTEFNVKWKLTLEEFAVFEKFYEQDLMQGIAFFNISLVNGVGQTTYLARFKEPYDAQTDRREFNWEVTATLEVMSRPLLA